MKLLKFILFFAELLLLVACHPDRPYPKAMLQAMQCMEQHPDSALLYLASLDSVIPNESEETRMYHALLMTKAEYKEYVQHNSDSLMKEVVRFYEIIRRYRQTDGSLLLFKYRLSGYE